MDGLDKSSGRSRTSLAKFGTVAAYGAAGGVVTLGLAAKKAFREFEEAQKTTSPDAGGVEVDRRCREGDRPRGREPRRQAVTQVGDRRRGDPVGREPVADVHEDPQRGGQGQRHLQPGDVRDNGHVGGVGAGPEVVRDPGRQGTAGSGEGHHRAAGEWVSTSPSSRRNMVEGWVEEGDTLKAQRFILRELDDRVRGFGKGAGDGDGQAAGRLGQPVRIIGQVLRPTARKGYGEAGGLARQGRQDPQQPEADGPGEIQQDRRDDRRGGRRRSVQGWGSCRQGGPGGGEGVRGCVHECWRVGEVGDGRCRVFPVEEVGGREAGRRDREVAHRRRFGRCWWRGIVGEQACPGVRDQSRFRWRWR